MPWHHRVVRRPTKDPDEPWEYSIRELYFEKQNPDGTYEDGGWTADPIPPLGDSEDSLGYWLQKMTEALNKPTLTEEMTNEEGYRGASRRTLDLHRLMDVAESLSVILHELECRGVDLSESEDAEWSRATGVIQEMRAIYGLEAPKTRGKPHGSDVS